MTKQYNEASMARARQAELDLLYMDAYSLDREIDLLTERLNALRGTIYRIESESLDQYAERVHDETQEYNPEYKE